MARLWPDYSRTMAGLWLDYGRTMAGLLWPDYGRTIARLWPDYGWTITGLWPDYGRTNNNNNLNKFTSYTNARRPRIFSIAMLYNTARPLDSTPPLVRHCQGTWYQPNTVTLHRIPDGTKMSLHLHQLLGPHA